MPLVGFIGEDGERYSLADALEACRKGSDAFPMPYPLLKGIVDAQQDRGDRISATSILHCLRSEYLTRREPYYTRPASLYAMFRGTLFHSLMEANAPANARIEERHVKKVNGIEISGQFDSLLLYELDEREDGKRYVLQDWKTTTKLPTAYSSGASPSPYSTHVEQLNVYRWLLDLPVEETRVEVWYFNMEGFVRTVLKDGTGRSKVNQLWSDEKVEAFISERIVKLHASFMANTPMPYRLVDEDAKWQCDYCPVRQRCADLANVEAEVLWRRNAGMDPVGSEADISPEWSKLVEGVFARMESKGAEQAAAEPAKRRRGRPPRNAGTRNSAK